MYAETESLVQGVPTHGNWPFQSEDSPISRPLGRITRFKVAQIESLEGCDSAIKFFWSINRYLKGLNFLVSGLES